MTKRQALAKLKKFWIDNEGGDYMSQLLQIRKELPQGHESAEALNEEIKAIEQVYSAFLAWADSPWAKRKIGKK